LFGEPYYHGIIKVVQRYKKIHSRRLIMKAFTDLFMEKANGLKQEYSTIDESRILGLAALAHRSRKGNRYVIYPNMKDKKGKETNLLFSIKQDCRESVDRQHNAEATVCLLYKVKQFASVVYADIENLDKKYTEYLIVSLFDYELNTEKNYLIPIKNKKLKIKDKTVSDSITEISPRNYIGNVIKNGKTFEELAKEAKEFVNRSLPSESQIA
jgi:hypothetical protein